MQAAGLYNDFGALASLRTEARADAEATLDEVAQQFESLFVQMMLKSMRDATMKGGLFDSHQLETYEQMFDQQLSLDLARQGGVGLADVIVRQLGGPASNPTTGAAGLDAYRARALPLGATQNSLDVPEGGAAEPTSRLAGPLASTPAEFIERLRPLASGAARELGVDPDVLIAQAALETGWGQRVIADGHGSSNNLFNIKAGPAWSGPTVEVATIEYRDGVAVRENAAFRAYATPADSFSDYVVLIRDNPRYAAALDAAGDGAVYLRSLQAAGYATDPAYADKILAILARDGLFGRGSLAEAGGGLKKAADLPLAG